ncbi:MAG: hypothetical protein ACRDSZ_20735, partial [Pseudonocardiaceae bacterium]
MLDRIALVAAGANQTYPISARLPRSEVPRSAQRCCQPAGILTAVSASALLGVMLLVAGGALLTVGLLG